MKLKKRTDSDCESENEDSGFPHGRMNLEQRFESQSDDATHATAPPLSSTPVTTPTIAFESPLPASPTKALNRLSKYGHTSYRRVTPHQTSSPGPPIHTSNGFSWGEPSMSPGQTPTDSCNDNRAPILEAQPNSLFRGINLSSLLGVEQTRPSLSQAQAKWRTLLQGNQPSLFSRQATVPRQTGHTTSDQSN